MKLTAFLEIRPVALLLAFGALGLTASCGEDAGGEKAAKGHGASSPAEQAPPKGPHGGRLLSEGTFETEVTIFEKGVPPEFRVYFYENQKPVDPKQVKLSVVLHRLGGRTNTFEFAPQDDFLRSPTTVEEPHSFDAKIRPQYNGKSYDFAFSQYEARTEITPEGLKNASVGIEAAGPARMKNTLEFPGQIVLNPDKVAHVVPRFAGVVTEVRKTLGDKVSKGEVMAVIDSHELALARMDYIQATHKLQFAKTSLDREELLWKKKISPEEEYLARRNAFDEARISVQTSQQRLKALGLELPKHDSDADHEHKENMAHHELKAPLDGIVIEKHLALGEALKEDADIFTVADLTTVVARVTIYAKDLKQVRSGQTVTVRAESLDAEVSGKVAYLGAVLGEDTRTAPAHVSIPNTEGHWRPGLFVSVQIVEDDVEVPVAVRTEALQRFRDWDVVFIQDGNQFEAVPLKLGRRNGEWVEVLKGVAAGQKYVSRNSFLVKADILKAGASHDH